MIIEEQKKRIVQEILKTPIIASSTYYSKPCLVSDSKNNNYIISGQKYKGCSDEDMCDFAEFSEETFVEKHYLAGSFFVNNTVVEINTVNDARKCISMRAENLSEKEFRDLYKYFEETFGKIIVDKFSGK